MDLTVPKPVARSEVYTIRSTGASTNVLHLEDQLWLDRPQLTAIIECGEVGAGPKLADLDPSVAECDMVA